MFNKTTSLLILLTAIVLSGCEKEGPAERAGDAIDDAAQELQNQGKDLGNKIEDACEDMKEGVGAADSDC